MTNYPYNEDQYEEKFKAYLEKAASNHYTKKIQISQFITQRPDEGLGFLRGNGLKYLDRYGIKNGFNQDDVFKCMHYCLMMLYHVDHNMTGTSKLKTDPPADIAEQDESGNWRLYLNNKMIEDGAKIFIAGQYQKYVEESIKIEMAKTLVYHIKDHANKIVQIPEIENELRKKTI